MKRLEAATFPAILSDMMDYIENKKPASRKAVISIAEARTLAKVCQALYPDSCYRFIRISWYGMTGHSPVYCVPDITLCPCESIVYADDSIMGAVAVTTPE